MMEALRSSETSVVTKATRRNIKEDGILHTKALAYVIIAGINLWTTLSSDQLCLSEPLVRKPTLDIKRQSLVGEVSTSF
jgi:hypothetical protein